MGFTYPSPQPHTKRTHDPPICPKLSKTPRDSQTVLAWQARGDARNDSNDELGEEGGAGGGGVVVKEMGVHQQPLFMHLALVSPGKIVQMYTKGGGGRESCWKWVAE